LSVTFSTAGVSASGAGAGSEEPQATRDKPITIASSNAVIFFIVFSPIKIDLLNLKQVKYGLMGINRIP
jgi:hypothetical protein